MKQQMKWLPVLALLLITATACVAITPTAVPVSTSAPTATPTPTPLSPTPTPTPTLAPTPIPPPLTLTPLDVACSAPPIPPVDEGSPSNPRRAEGCLHVTLNPGDVWERDGFDLAREVGYTGEEPPCAAFFLALSWAKTSDEPARLWWSVIRQGIEQVVGEGDSGIIRYGCGFYRLHNDGPNPAKVDVRVAVDIIP